MFGLKFSELVNRVFVSVIGLLLLSSAYYFDRLHDLSTPLFFVLYSELLIGCYESGAKRWKRILVFISMFLYMIFGIGALTEIIDLNFLPQLLISVFAIDTSAFLFGKILGGRKMIPIISPNKTWAGFLAATFIGAFAFAYLLAKFFMLERAWVVKFLYGIFFAIVVQMGDLLVSGAKRICKKKDFVNWLPGHGALWDRLDSIFAGAIFSIILAFFFIAF